MKNKLTQILLAALVLISACKDSKEEAPAIIDNSNSYSIVKENRALVVESSATWCAPCHTFGIPANKAIIDSLGDEITNMVVFGTQGCNFQTTIGSELLPVFYGSTNSISVPAFFFNKENLNQNGNIEDLLSKVVRKSNDFRSNEVEFGIGGDLILKGDSLTLNWSIQNFTEREEAAYVSAYLIEEEVIRGSTTYSNVLRDNLLTNTFGNFWVVKSNEVRELRSINYALNDDWKSDKLKVVVIVWGPKDRIINTLTIK